MRKAYKLLALGTILDHATTFIFLFHPMVYETNPYTVWLMRTGIWAFVDSLVSLLFVGLVLLIEWAVERWGKKELRDMAILPAVIYGGLRLLAGLHNTVIGLHVLGYIEQKNLLDVLGVIIEMLI